MEKNINLHLNGAQGQGCAWTVNVDLFSSSCTADNLSSENPEPGHSRG